MFLTQAGSHLHAAIGMRRQGLADAPLLSRCMAWSEPATMAAVPQAVDLEEQSRHDQRQAVHALGRLTGAWIHDVVVAATTGILVTLVIAG